jgi:hypothetical protein
VTENGLEQFREMSKSRPDIRQRLQRVLGESDFAALAVKIGSEEGYRFTGEDVLAWTRGRTEVLSDAQLEGITGGLMARQTLNVGEQWYWLFYA